MAQREGRSERLVDHVNARGSERGMRELMDEIFPICRSITGNGVRSTLAIVSRTLPLNPRQRLPVGGIALVGQASADLGQPGPFSFRVGRQRPVVGLDVEVPASGQFQDSLTEDAA